MPVNARLIVKIDEHSGAPFVQVPPEIVWDLVEHLSGNRAAVNYTYQADYFTVRFLRMNQATAQAMLDDWRNLVPAHADRGYAVH